MNILHINYSDIIGGRFNGYYMLGKSDDMLNPNMAVWRKKSNRKNVYLLPPHNKVLKFVIEKCIHLGAKLGLDHLISIFGFLLLSKQKYFKAADIIHLHIIHGDTNLSILSLPKLCKNKTVVWTFHDQWAVTGGCIHPFDCHGVNQGCPSYCPYPRYNSFFKHKFPNYLWKIKKYCYSRSDFNIIVSTDWMKEKIESTYVNVNRDNKLCEFKNKWIKD